MPTPPHEAPSATAPWAARRQAKASHRLRQCMIVLVVIGLLGIIAWGFWPKPVLVETAKAGRSALTVRVSEEGKTRIRNRYVVAAPVAGRMHRVGLKPGDEVKAGETLLTAIEPVAAPLLDPRSREQAEAEILLREAACRQAAESLAAAKEAQRVADAERDRMRGVRRADTVSKAELDRAEGQSTIKAAEVRAAGFAMKVMDFRLTQARTALARPAANAGGGVFEVTSPVSGRVLKVMQESEMVVLPGQPILEIGDPADLEVEAEILSRDAVGIKAGDAVAIEQWGGEAPLKGRVRRVEPAAFTKISALGVEEQRVIVLCDLVESPGADKVLGDRYRVEARVEVWHGDDLLTVPAGALFREGNVWKTFVYQNGRAVATVVQAGHTDGRLTEITGGLEVGTEVLLHPPDTVKDGTRVTRR